MIESEKTTLVVAEDEWFYRQGLMSVLEAAPNIEVLGVGETVDETVELARRYQPKVVLVDLSASEAANVELAKRLSAEVPESAVIILTRFSSPEQVAPVLHAGVRGYIFKQELKVADDLLRSLELVARGGEVPFSLEVARAIAMVTRTERGITPRQRDVLERLAQGKSNREIANDLGLSEQSVKNHLGNLFRKFSVKSRSALVAVAQENQIG